MKKMVQVGSLYLNRRMLVGMFVSAVVAAIGLQASAGVSANNNQPVADSVGFADQLDIIIAAPTPTPSPRSGCCIPAEDRCSRIMTIAECDMAGGQMVRNCNFCARSKITNLDPSLETEMDTADASTPTVNP